MGEIDSNTFLKYHGNTSQTENFYFEDVGKGVHSTQKDRIFCICSSSCPPSNTYTKVCRSSTPLAGVKYGTKDYSHTLSWTHCIRKFHKSITNIILSYNKKTGIESFVMSTLYSIYILLCDPYLGQIAPLTIKIHQPYLQQACSSTSNLSNSGICFKMKKMHPALKTYDFSFRRCS